MKFKRYVRSYLFYAVLVLLTVSIAVSAISFVTISKRNKAIDEANAKIISANEQIESIKSQLTQKEAENGQLASQLEQSKSENQRLENENKNYRQQIEKLSLEKQTAVENALANANSPQSAYPKPDKVCYLTFDDGPSDNTLKILDILNKYGAKATFFVVGTAKLQYLPKIKESGNAIGLHSNTHVYSSIYSSEEAYFNDLEALSQKVEAIIGEKIKVIRFPGGSSNQVNKINGGMRRLITLVKGRGYAYFDWNVGSGDADAKSVSAKKIVNNVLNGAANKSSICVLMHDTSAKSTTVEALPGIIDGLKKRGYAFDVLTPQTFSYSHIK